MGFVGSFVEAVQHVEEVLDVGEVLGGLVVGAADSVTVGVGGDGWDQADQSVDLFVSGVLVFVDALAGEGGVGFGVQRRIG